MYVSGVIRDVWRDSWGDAPTACWAAEITPDRPVSRVRQPSFRAALTIPCPFAIGDRVTVPTLSAGGHVTLADSTPVRMLGGLYDRSGSLP